MRDGTRGRSHYEKQEKKSAEQNIKFSASSDTNSYCNSKQLKVRSHYEKQEKNQQKKTSIPLH